MTEAPLPRHYAAIDLGSNSFHLIVAREVQGELQPLDRLGEKVQLAAGLDADHRLDEAAINRGLECLGRFAQRLGDIPAARIRVVGTNTLRAARNRRVFIQAAEALLGVPVEVISGREEARLIYLGVAHALADDAERRLVIDIGGGSTELIIGERFSPLELESLHMGCVSYTQRYFPKGKLSRKHFQRAINAAQLEILNIRHHYRRLGWAEVAGASGTIKAAVRLTQGSSANNTELRLAELEALQERLLACRTLDAIDFPEIKPNRAAVLPGGIAILRALFEAFDIDRLRYSDGALREGLLYDMSGRKAHEDVRERTLNALAQRYHCDPEQAQAVRATLEALLQQTSLDQGSQREPLMLAARLHECGLAISHSQFQKHGAYILRHSDMMGFSREEQERLAFLVQAHRRKLPREALAQFPAHRQSLLLRQAALLRLAVLLNRARPGGQAVVPAIQLEALSLKLSLEPGWLEQHPLTYADLEQERAYLAQAGFELELES